MEVQPRIGPAQHERVGQRGLYQFCFQCFTQLPSYHFTAKEVQDDCQVQPSFHRGDVSDIADPDLIDSTRLQILYQIGCSAWRDPSDWTGLNCSSASFGWFFLLGFLVALSIESG